jgi:hypothetical protein
MNWSGLIGNVAGTIFRQYGVWRAGKEYLKELEAAERERRGGMKRVRELQRPYREFGEEGMDTYQQAMKRYEGLLQGEFDYKKTPGYQFRLQEGLKSIGVAGGEVNQRNLTGAQLKAITAYTQDYATADYGEQYNRYADTLQQYLGGAAKQVGVGQQATDVLTQEETGFAQDLAKLKLRRGEIRSGIHLGQSSAAATGVENFFGTSGGASIPLKGGGTLGGGTGNVAGGLQAVGGGQGAGGGL